ncbi:hypothetical protein DLAC_11813 [Tieghemostelium lacteum]|uniref:Uncharacterized protein n=1 Tax=Tieghemostelium lacteum TaxID=361077 RepID=A0A151Z4N4_TIELA|nr:hypothetical protein DLAC_11813 [Tieghemostelium lacteum]|eukprot:KYQ88901.1 hypothetical protein DLAC_11813 [Tieghemostelium lacteum]
MDNNNNSNTHRYSSSMNSSNNLFNDYEGGNEVNVNGKKIHMPMDWYGDTSGRGMSYSVYIYYFNLMYFEVSSRNKINFLKGLRGSALAMVSVVDPLATLTLTGLLEELDKIYKRSTVIDFTRFVEKAKRNKYPDLLTFIDFFNRSRMGVTDLKEPQAMIYFKECLGPNFQVELMKRAVKARTLAELICECLELEDIWSVYYKSSLYNPVVQTQSSDMYYTNVYDYDAKSPIFPVKGISI